MNAIASIMNLAGPDLIIILLIILVLFGAKKLPELARGMGQAVKEFQKAKDEFGDELHKAGANDSGKQAADADVKAAPLTLPRNTDSSPPTAATRPDPNQAIPPGDKADQV
jgi:sec-independent protein translocase protein TatA